MHTYLLVDLLTQSSILYKQLNETYCTNGEKVIHLIPCQPEQDIGIGQTPKEMQTQQLVADSTPSGKEPALPLASPDTALTP